MGVEVDPGAGLHAFTGVAELKRPRSRRNRGRSGTATSPRLHRRGRIEAARRTACSSRRSSRLHAFTGVAELKPSPGRAAPSPASTRLHAFTGVAELKRASPSFVRPKLPPSPRLHRRGRIEASASGMVRASSSSGLHAFTGVAELKLRQRRRESDRPRGRVSTPSPAWPN